MLSDEEFGDRKRVLLMEKEKIMKKLRFKAKYLFFKYKEGVKETNEKIDSLVPKNIVSDQSNLENYLKNSLWCRGEDLNLQTLSGTATSMLRVCHFATSAHSARLRWLLLASQTATPANGG